MSTLKLDYLEAGHGTEIAINVGTTLLGTASQFKITGGTSGQALITDGSGGISFGSVDAFPAQSTQAGKFLTTDGTVASWVDESTINTSHTTAAAAAKKALIYAIIFGG